MSREVRPIIEKLVKVNLSDLHVRYIPVVTPGNLWRNDMSLKNSPHVELMKIFNKHGLSWLHIYKSRYYRERQHRFNIGMPRWHKRKISEHIIDRYRIYKSIKKYGYDKNKDRANPIQVLKIPFWKSRFKLENKWLDGMEIWNGAGRCAAAYILGYKQLPVLLVKDGNPGSNDKGKFADKLKNVKGVWDDW